MEKLLPLCIVAIFVTCLTVERLFPARALPAVRGWVQKGVIFAFITAALHAAVPLLLAPLLVGKTLLDLSALPLWLAALLTLLVADFVGYWVHRATHTSAFLWRWTHQLHHSAERMDVIGSPLFHPLDTALAVSATTAALAILGVRGEAAAIAGIAGVFFGIGQHLNVRTPRWLGYLMQRPEGHSLHHQRGVHAYNYGQLAIWDLVFGTWRNPADFVEEYGFWDGASARTWDMLIGRDVSQPPATAAPRDAAAQK